MGFEAEHNISSTCEIGTERFALADHHNASSRASSGFLARVCLLRVGIEVAASRHDRMLDAEQNLHERALASAIFASNACTSPLSIFRSTPRSTGHGTKRLFDLRDLEDGGAHVVVVVVVVVVVIFVIAEPLFEIRCMIL